MRLNDKQKKLAKNYLVYSAGYIVVYPIVKSLLDGEFTWEAIWVSLITVLAVGLLNLLLIIGSKNPKD